MTMGHGSLCRSIFASKPQSFNINPPSLKLSSVAEVSAGIICSCMPILPVLVRGHGSKIALFASLRLFFTRFTSSKFPRLFGSDKSHFQNKPYLVKGDNHSKAEIGDYMRLESGANIAKSNDEDDKPLVFTPSKSPRNHNTCTPREPSLTQTDSPNTSIPHFIHHI